MRIRKLVNVETEVEISVTAEDIAEAITQQDHERVGVVCQGINGCAQWLKAIADSMIAEMKEGQREVIANFLREEAQRYVPNAELCHSPSTTRK